MNQCHSLSITIHIPSSQILDSPYLRYLRYPYYPCMLTRALTALMSCSLSLSWLSSAPNPGERFGTILPRASKGRPTETSTPWGGGGSA